MVGIKEAIKHKTKINWALKGYSFVWMIPIYGLTAFIGPYLFDPLQVYPLIVRLLIYTGLIFVIEYITGWIITKTPAVHALQKSGVTTEQIVSHMKKSLLDDKTGKEYSGLVAAMERQNIS